MVLAANCSCCQGSKLTLCSTLPCSSPMWCAVQCPVPCRCKQAYSPTQHVHSPLPSKAQSTTITCCAWRLSTLQSESCLAGKWKLCLRGWLTDNAEVVTTTVLARGPFPACFIVTGSSLGAAANPTRTPSAMVRFYRIGLTLGC